MQQLWKFLKQLSHSNICDKFGSIDIIKNCMEIHRWLTLVQEWVTKTKMNRTSNWKKKKILPCMEGNF